MGTLDDAIREHLELKRQHGAGEQEIREAEAEAFGPGEEALDVPGASITAPAGEGDQLDKVFSPLESGTESVSGIGGPESEEGAVAEVEAAVAPPVEEATVEAEAVDVEPPEVEVEEVEEEDAGDALERERDHLLGHPTENYDVDAAIAEEEELDLLSESRLADELDRALGGPEELPPVTEEPVAAGDGPESAELDLGDLTAPGGDVVEERIDVEEEVAIVEEDVEVLGDVASEPDLEPIPEGPASEDPVTDASDSEEIPLDETPDFLEDSPDGEDLWFEQKEPKDFDFGD